MKNKVTLKKMSLNKEAISILTPNKMKAVVGGGVDGTPTINTTLKTTGGQQPNQ